LTLNSDVYVRPGGAGTNYIYQRIQLWIETEAFYTIRVNSNFDPYLYLYGGPLDPLDPTSGLLYEDDDTAGNSQPQISLSLAGQSLFELTVTSFAEGVIGDFTIYVTGLYAVTLTQWQREYSQ
jgi:hypothetical protein